MVLAVLRELVLVELLALELVESFVLVPALVVEADVLTRDELPTDVGVLLCAALVGCDGAVEVAGAPARVVGVGPTLAGRETVGVVPAGEPPGRALVVAGRVTVVAGRALVVAGRVTVVAAARGVVGGVVAADVVLGVAVRAGGEVFVPVAGGVPAVAPSRPGSPVAAGVDASTLLVPSTTTPSDPVVAGVEASAPSPVVVHVLPRDGDWALGAIESMIRPTPRSCAATGLPWPVGSVGAAATVACGATGTAASEGGVTVATATPAPTAARTSAPALTSARMIGAFTCPPEPARPNRTVRRHQAVYSSRATLSGARDILSAWTPAPRSSSDWSSALSSA